jgi:hypothetical protein
MSKRGETSSEHMGQIKGFRDLIVYQKAYKLAMDIFEISKCFPKEESIHLQIRFDDPHAQ